MRLTEYIEDKIDEDIRREYDVYSLDNMAGGRLTYIRELYYRALWDAIKEQMKV